MLYLAAAILAGIGSSQNVGEQTPAFVATADVRYHAIQVEGWFSSAAKIETGDGWATRLGADVWSGPLSIGASWAHRETSAWHKDRLYVRASAQHGPLRLLAEIAPDSPNLEAKGEARVRIRASWAVLESRFWVEYHSTVAQLGGYGWGMTMLVGWGHGL